MSENALQTRKMTRTRSPHHRVTYANQIQMTATAVDVRFRFGCVEQATAEEIIIEDQVDVILGPLEAHGLYKLLEKHLVRLNVEQVKEDAPEATKTKVEH